MSAITPQTATSTAGTPACKEKTAQLEVLDTAQEPEAGDLGVLAQRVEPEDLEQAARLEAVKARMLARGKVTARKVEGRIYLQGTSLYTPELADIILTRVAGGETVTSICRPREMPSAAIVMQWAMRNLDGFGDRYWEARRLGAHILVDQAKDIADDTGDDIATLQTPEGPRDVLNSVKVARDKLRIATRQWDAEKLAPEVYAPVADKKPESQAITVNIMSFQPQPPAAPALPQGVTLDAQPQEPKA